MLKNNVENEILNVKITDLTEKVLCTKQRVGDVENALNLQHLPPSIYITENEQPRNRAPRYQNTKSHRSALSAGYTKVI
jgi:hypothetical protein